MGASAERVRRDIETIAEFSAGGPGTHRLTFTPEYWAAVDYVAAELAVLGYERRTTVHGNTRFRARGVDWHAPAVAVGSHLDAVPRGGRFDGVAGVVAGVEVARLLAEQGGTLGRPYEVLVCAEEEGSRFGTVLTGSKAMVGRLTDRELGEMRDDSGTSYLEALRESTTVPGLAPAAALGAGDLAAYFELHIEQSLVLESAGLPVGIVQAIAGIRQYRVTYSGVANHAGATPMRLRTDSLAAAAQAVAAVEEITTASATGTTVGTVGMVVNEPNAANVIPERTVFSIDLRDADAATLDGVAAQVADRVRRVAATRGVGIEMQATSVTAPVVLSSRLRKALARSAEAQGIAFMEMPSGAVHDALEIAGVTDVAMVFVPSLAGRSHCPEEDTPYDALALGIDVLLGAVREAAA